MNNKQVLSALLIAIMIISIAASTATCAGTGWTEEEAWYTPIITTQTLPLLMFDSLQNSKPLSTTSSTTVTLTAVADATVKSWQPDSNFGSESVLSLSYSDIDEVCEAVTLLRFDVASALPEGAIIDSATLELFLVDGAGADPAPVAAHFVTSGWAESNVTWNSFPTAEPIGVISQVDKSPGSYKSWWVTSFAQEWQSGSNDGVYLRGPVDGTYYERTFESREHAESVPRLVVTYHLPSPAYTFTGSVYQGSPPDTSTPAGDVTVGLWGDEDEWPEAGFARVLLTSIATSDAGEFSLRWEEGDSHYPYLHVIELDPPGAYSTGAHAEEPGYVKNFNVVSYLDISPGTYGGIAFWDQMPAEKPDLVIINVWNENGTICYQMENVGDDVAHGGHCTALSVDGVYRVEDCVDEDLAPGAGMERCFEHGWECSPPEDVVVVCADHRGVVEERDEENNCMEMVVVCPPGEKPDLVITDLWNAEGTICYQIRNIGDGVSPEGYCTALIVDDEYRVCDQVDQDLEPGERLQGCFDYDWECTSPEDLVVVVADHEEGVAEVNETNNQREEIWKCDVVPPRIVHCPIVQEVTQESAVIFWETDEGSDSAVRYGKTARLYDLEERDSAMVIEHSVTLSRLEASTTYNFVVQSTDAGGNTVVSDEVTFETAPLPDAEDPIVSIIDPGECHGVVTIEAEAEDNIGVEKVEFYLDGALVFTDYSPPYELTLDTDKYENGEYALEAKADDLSGRFFIKDLVIDVDNLKDYTHPKVNITYPSQGETVSGKIDVNATLSDDICIVSARFYIDGNYTAYEPFNVSNPPADANVTFTWDTRKEKLGHHSIAVEVYDNEGKRGWHTISVYVVSEPPQPPPKYPRLTVTDHTVSRRQNCFVITLTVKNEGEVEATNVRILDGLQGFQSISRNYSHVDFLSNYNPKGKFGYCEIMPKLSIPPGQSRIYTYHAVPVLIYPKPTVYPTPQIGQFIDLYWDSPIQSGYHDYVNMPVSKTTDTYETIPKAHGNAVKSADYLIVTNPGRLYGYYKDDEVDVLLSTMARLAKLKYGVLGYLDTYDAYALDDLIEPNLWSLVTLGDNWAMRMHPSFSTLGGGYVLLVGEREIIPTWKTSGWNRNWKGGGTTNNVDFVDLIYADTTGSNWAPELIVGRIIGDTAAELSAPIQASIGVYGGLPGYGFDRSDALLVSGTDKRTKIQKKFTDNINEIEKIIKNEFTVDKLHLKDFTTTQSIEFWKRAIGNDVILYQGHGGVGSLGPIQTPPPLYDPNPFVFASACLAGNYEGEWSEIDKSGNRINHDEGDDGIAEAFFDSGTVVFIGSTQLSPISINCQATKKFFKTWDTYENIGEAFNDLKRDRWSHGKWWQFWVAEYNLYGDPKFGAVPPTDSQAAALTSAEQQPLSSLDVVVPDYEVTSSDGVDYVEIPGGDILLEEGEYRIPYYSVSVDYPKEHKVQYVALTDRSGMVTDTGLNIPITTMDIASSMDNGSLASNLGEGWFPDAEYRWEILQKPDGCSTLIIIIYPFNYNPMTTDVRFYRNYIFDINYTVSPAAIATLSTDSDEYEQGDTVIVDLILNNSGEAQDIIFSASVKRCGSGEVVNGLLLRTLKEFTGLASFTPQWDSNGVEPGYYCVEVTLKDTSSNVLDRQTEMFRLGISSGEIASFTATPECFDIGDEIEIEMVVENNGTVNITGTAVIRVLNSTGDAAYEFRHNVTNLTPSESISFSDTWDTSEAVAGSSYTIIGYVLYDSRSSDPATVTVQNTIVGDLNGDGEVTTADAGIALELAASGEYDPAADVDCDGQITSLDALMIVEAAAGNIELEGCES